MIDFLRKLMGFQPAPPTSAMSPDQQYAGIVAAAHVVLKSAGFAKQGGKFRRFYGSNMALVQFQRSQYNDATDVRFTINVSVISATLAEHLGGQKDMKKASEWDGHLRQRIGFFDTPPTDKWWKLDNGSDYRLIGEEIVQRLKATVLPFLDTHSTDEQLLTYWKSGKAAGMTEFQREKFVTILEKTSPATS